ncbi:hypothetical protein [Desulforegula conservatrix]|uniref:hypothetical protein n=1 Tax=Desulforegula conservatrix TaxID=153026 RepID=UPI0004893A8A|nr:hypothetical protein [Desulforegula conservatrix]
MKSRLLSALLMFFLLFSNSNYALSEIREDEFNKYSNQFLDDLNAIYEYQNRTFLQRHKWKLIGGAIVITGAVITVATMGAGAPAGASLVAGGSTVAATGGVITAAAGGTVVVMGTSLSSPGSDFYKWLDSRKIILTQADLNSVDQAIQAKHQEIMQADSIENAQKMITDIAITTISQHR